MGIISTRWHGLLDYLVSAVLILSPWLFGFYRGGSETWIPLILGASTILISLLTNYEFSLVKLIPMPVHLGLDIAQAVVLGYSPWLFDFEDFVHKPFIVLAVFEIAVVVFTKWKFTMPDDAEGSTFH